MSQGFPGGPGGRDPLYQLRQDIVQARQEILGAVGKRLDEHAGWMRARGHELDKRMTELATIAQAMRGSRSGGGDVDPNNVRIEDLPGRRVPYVLMIDVPIGANSTSMREQSVTISQEGPFVAVRRMATFLSAYQYELTLPDSTTSRFAGRSFGRWRPIHSAWDTSDGLASIPRMVANQPTSVASGGLFGVYSLTQTASGFRTMEFDGRIAVVNAGSSYPRQNLQGGIPSSLWTPQINAPQDLGCLDFFERGEVISVQVNPGHVNNPPAGNASGQFMDNISALVGPRWPFIDGQYDPHEGVINNQAWETDPAFAYGTTDAVARLPDGVLTVAWEGYRIIQPVGPVRR